MLPKPDFRLFLRFLGAFLVCIGLWYLLRQPYTRLVVRGGAEVLSPFAGIDAGELITEDEQGRFLLAPPVQDDSGQADNKGILLHVYPVTWNIVFLGSLILLTSRQRLKRLWPYVLLATALLWLSHVVFLSLTIFAQVAPKLRAAGEPAFQDESLTRTLALTVQGYGVTLSLVLPFLLYAPVFFLKGWSSRSKKGKRGPAPGRNAPCPCGSGLKYKRCCGR